MLIIFVQHHRVVGRPEAHRFIAKASPAVLTQDFKNNALIWDEYQQGGYRQ